VPGKGEACIPSASDAAWKQHVVLAYLDEPPFCAPGPDGRPTGCDMEVAFAVLAAIGVGRIETRLVTFADLLPGVAAGAWTLNTPLFVTSERSQLVDFSRPVWSLADGFMVRAGNPKRLTSYEAVAADGTAVLGVVADQVQEQSGLKAGIPADRIRRFATQQDAVTGLLDGAVDAYASVAMAHRGYRRGSPDPRLSVVDFGASGTGGEGTRAAYGAYSFAKSSRALRHAFDAQLGCYLGTAEHRALMAGYGFTDGDVDRVVRPG
jgi:polar amino acid transport system substrate-binding protein